MSDPPGDEQFAESSLKVSIIDDGIRAVVLLGGQDRGLPVSRSRLESLAGVCVKTQLDSEKFAAELASRRGRQRCRAIAHQVTSR